jgi:hypothetical protein
MKTNISFALVFFFVFIGNAMGQNHSGQQKTKAEAEVWAIFKMMVKSGEALDYDALSKGVDDQNHAGFIVNNVYYAKYDSLTNLLKGRAGGVSKQTIVFQKQKITAITEDVVLVIAIGDSTVELMNGTQIPLKFYWTFVYQKIDGQWKVVQSHQSGGR